MDTKTPRNYKNKLIPISPLLSLGFLLLAGVIMLLLFAGTGNGEHWLGEERLTDADAYAASPAVGIDSHDNIYMVWEEGAGPINESKDIHFMKISPSGNIIVNRTIGNAFALSSAWPDIAVESDGTAHIVWQDSWYRNIYYMEIARDGATLIPGMPIAQGTLGAYTPSIAVDDDGRVHIVWLDLRITNQGADYGIYYSELDPSKAGSRIGSVCDEDIRIIDDTCLSTDLRILDILELLEHLFDQMVLEHPPLPDLAVNSEGEVHVVWTDGRDGNPEIYYSVLDPSRAPRNGSSVNASLISIVDNYRLTSDTALSLQPEIAIGPNGEVHLAFTDNRSDSFEVYYERIIEGVMSTTLQLVSDSDPASSGLSLIFVDDHGNIYISWRDMSSQYFEVFLSKLTPAGKVIWNNLRISHSESCAGEAPIVVDSNCNPIIFWQDNRSSTYQIYFNRTGYFPDLTISHNDIYTDAIHGVPSNLYIRIHNDGNIDAFVGVEVSAGSLNWSTELKVMAGDNATAVFSWTPVAGVYPVSVHLDKQEKITEAVEDNNFLFSELQVPYPPYLDIEGVTFSSGREDIIVEEGGQYSTPLLDQPCWLNLSIFNSGGGPTGDIGILVEGRSDSPGLVPVVLSTHADMISSSGEVISFAFQGLPGVWNYSVILDSEGELPDSWKGISSLNFTLNFILPPDPHIRDITFRGERVAGESLDIVVSLSNPGEFTSEGLLVLEIDGREKDRRYIRLIAGEDRDEIFEWRAETGKHSIRAALLVVPDTDPDNNEMKAEVTIKDDPGINVVPIVVAGISVLTIATALILFMESVKYPFLKFLVVPLYTRLKRGKILDHFMRGQVYGFIKANPGAHYNLIRRKLNINNGALAYHIAVLEREKFVRSRMDGTMKRFYPSDMNVPKGHELTEMERRIIDVIRVNPGFSQKEVANSLGLSPQVINYHIKSLARTHILRLARVGKRTLCYIDEGLDSDA